MTSPGLALRLSGAERARGILDALARLDPFYRPKPLATDPQRIVVPALWGLGDAVLLLPLIQGLRARWPKARIEVLGKPHLAELLAGEGVAIRAMTAPWTFASGKYRLWTKPWRAMLRAIGRLRRERPELWIITRFDPREILLARACAPAAIVGMGTMGGVAWLTVDLHLNARAFHQLYGGVVAQRAAHALGLTVAAAPRFSTPLVSQGLGPVVVAFGASHRVRLLQAAQIERILTHLAKHEVEIVVVAEPDGRVACRDAGPVNLPPRARLWHGPLADLKTLLANARLFVGADSGPMHIAGAQGVPVVVIFGAGSIERFGPIAGSARVIATPMACRPCFDACLYPRPLCLDDLDLAEVEAAIDQFLLVSGPRIRDGEVQSLGSPAHPAQDGPVPS